MQCPECFGNNSYRPWCNLCGGTGKAPDGTISQPGERAEYEAKERAEYEMRARDGHDAHHRYAGKSGAGPDGMTCRKCAHMIRSVRHGRRIVNFCSLVRKEERETIWTGKQACEFFSPCIPGLAK